MTNFSRFGFSKADRIVDDNEFEHVYKNGKMSKSGCLIIRSLPNNLSRTRLGVAVSKKVFRHAVIRNRIKRLIREAFRLNKSRLPGGFDFIIGVRVRDSRLITLPAVQSGLGGFVS